MNTGRILKTGLALGVFANAFDYVVNTYLYPMFGQTPAFLNDTTTLPMTSLILGDFVGALVFVWFFDLVRGSFGAGVKGGATFGLAAGILMNFPIWIFMHLLIKDWSYGMSWTWTCLGVVYAILAGAVAGAVYDKTGTVTA